MGIDEAGFGPILGPLVVSSTVFSLPHHLLKTNLWQTLKKSVGKTRKALAGRLLIADSKKAYNRKKGPKHLQRTTLACLNCLNKKPETLTQLIEVLTPESLERLAGYPWYKELSSYNLKVDRADIAIASEVFNNDIGSSEMKLLDCKSHCIDVAYYNQMVNSVKNKANVLFTITSQLIKNAFDKFPDEDLQIIVDRQGGRTHYGGILQRMFPGVELKIILENPTTSSYELKNSGKRMNLHFVVGADNRFLPVSLASMMSKYIRELLIDNLNRYFIGFHDKLLPTAGYWKDGLRFIDDIKKHIPHIKFDSEQLIRCR